MKLINFYLIVKIKVSQEQEVRRVITERERDFFNVFRLGESRKLRLFPFMPLQCTPVFVEHLCTLWE